MPSTQPETPIIDMQMDWERPQHFSSQPVSSRIHGGASQRDIWASLSEDPLMSQFAPQPSIPQSLVRTLCHLNEAPLLTHSQIQTQHAQAFYDICPPQPLTRFYSTHEFPSLLPILSESLHRLGIAVPPLTPQNNNTEVWIKIRTMDSRRCHLAGDIIAERVAEDLVQVTFSKTKGDPLEWRRFFKVRGVLITDNPFARS